LWVIDLWVDRVDVGRLERESQRSIEVLRLLGRWRQAIFEYPSGMLKKRIFGNAGFLLRRLYAARAEMALGVFAYNFKRVTKLLGEGGCRPD
jgi:hypothetical protein